jgi:hypothetical protein
MPIGTYALGKRSITSAETLILLPVIGTMLIDSTPPGHDGVDAAEGHALGGEGDGLEARRAEAVDGHARGGLGEASEEAHHAGHVEALLAFGHRAPEDEIVDLLGVELRNLGHQGADHLTREVVGAGEGEGPLEGAAPGAAHSGCNDYVGHLGVSFSCAGACCS